MAPTPEATAASPAKRTRKPRSKPTKRYPTDVTDAQWALIEPLLPPPATRGRAEKHPRREIVNAILYLDRAGCFHVLAALAEFEAALISERTLDGLEAARARGRKGGRRPKLGDRQVALARQMHASGEHTVAEIAKTFNVTRPTIYRALEGNEQAVAAR